MPGDVHEANGSGHNYRKSESGSQNLTTAFAVRAIEGENVHLYLRPAKCATFIACARIPGHQTPP